MKRSDIFDRWAPWVLLLLVAAVPLAFAFSLYDTFDLPKMTLVCTATWILLGLWLWQASSGAGSFKPTGLILPLLTFLLVAWISSGTSIDPSRSLFGAYRTYVYGSMPLTAFAFLLWFASQIHSEKATERILTAAVLSGALAGFYGVLQYTGNEIFDLMPRIVGGRVWGSLGNPVYFGALCSMALPLTLRRVSFIHVAATVLVVSGLAISLSRGAWLGDAAALFYLVFVFRQKLHMNGKRLASCLVGLVLIVLAFSPVRERLFGMLSTREGSNTARIEGWKGGLHIWRNHPVLGTGPDTFFEAFRPYRNITFLHSAGSEVTQAHAHNEFIQIASTMGTLGLAAWLWMIWTVARRVGKEQPFLVASLFAIFVQNQFNPSSSATAAWAAVFVGLAIRREVPRALPESRAWPFLARVCALAIPIALGVWMVILPLEADMQYKEGIVLEARGKLVNAIVRYRDAVRLRPDNETYQTSLGNAARSLAQLSPTGTQQKAFWQEAVKAAEMSVKRHPSNPDAWNDLGVAEMWLTQMAGVHRLPEAKAAFEKAIALDPVFVDAWANMAKWHHIAGDLEQEKETWKLVLRLYPKHQMALDVLGGHVWVKP